MDRRSALLSILLLAPLMASADEYCIEDISGTPVNKQADIAIREYAVNEKQWLDKCTFAWEPFDLEDGTGGTTLIATTAKACGWGAAAGPLWLLRSDNNTYTILLSSSGYTLVTTAQRNNGLPDIKISSGTAGWFHETHWSYNGTQYIKISDRSNVRNQIHQNGH